MTMSQKAVLEADLSITLCQYEQTVTAIESLQERADRLQCELALAIIDGATTGDQFTDFLLVTEEYCNEEVRKGYDQLTEAIQSDQNQQVLVIQKAMHTCEGIELLLCNLYLAQLRRDRLKFDIDTMSFYVPVHSGYLVLWQMVQENVMIQRTDLKMNEWLRVGPLHTIYTYPKEASKDKENMFFVPVDSRCEFEFLPTQEDNVLLLHGIDGIQLHDLRKQWIAFRSKVLTM